jgi:hypothetical protein
MRTSILSGALLVCASLLTACNSTTTAADYARMDAYAGEHAPGARGAPSPGDLAAMGLFKTSEQLRREGNEFASPTAAPPSSLANVRLIVPKS